MGEQKKRRFFRYAPAAVLVAATFAACDYGRMYDQDSVRTYERKMVTPDRRAIPVVKGYQLLLKENPEDLRNPLISSRARVEEGRIVYEYFCVQCHGPLLDGKGTVGQSFAPPPANLLSSTTLEQSDGVLYRKIRLGFKRHPALYSTVSEQDGWAVVIYIRSKGDLRDR
jgi:mono/diheme cytochrome c family protein